MKKKHLNIVLFILVFVIYGGVFFKIFKKKEVQLDNSAYNSTFSQQVSDFNIKRSNFNISSMKSDPFGISKMRTRKPIVKMEPKSTFNSVPQKTKTSMTWPRVTYYGFIKNNSKTTRLALIKINNKLHRKREQEKIDNILIVKAYNDSIKLSFNNTTKTIIKVNE
ncbi:hypothetical protein [uncultured Psychroserpens sp.]|uniref:hypothetical protein n=1 Tax=uncultured Psychroserpens sp. TaxID=255436 RepID=UPI002625232F|nr:hypothetical protein [uncultured Psychroserpens sp.]